MHWKIIIFEEQLEKHLLKHKIIKISLDGLGKSNWRKKAWIRLVDKITMKIFGRKTSRLKVTWA